jgi:signal transduction histidine kinase
MSDAFDGERRRSGRRSRSRGHRRRRRGSHRDSDRYELEDEDLPPEQRALHAAHAAAERKTQLAGDVLWYVGVTALLLFFITPIGVIVGLFWGLKVAKDVYEFEIEPRLRKRFVEQEVEKQVHASLSQQRLALEGEHARSLEKLSASIAHEIRNPITAAKSLVQQMGETPTARENVDYARVALEELQRVERSVSHLLRFAREEEGEMVEVRMADVVESALESFRERAQRSGIALEHRIDCDGAMIGNAEQLRRVLINLVGNAIDALDESGTPAPRVDVHMGENLAGSEVWVQVKDNGPGIDRELLAKMWSPFHTSKANGTGLGLPICKKLVDAHGGTIEVSSDPGAGAEFLLTFPKEIPAREEPS